jgi:hypothetical protein
MESENQIKRRETIAKWDGKTIRDITSNETFKFDPQVDWYVLCHHPERFKEVTEE